MNARSGGYLDMPRSTIAGPEPSWRVFLSRIRTSRQFARPFECRRAPFPLQFIEAPHSNRVLSWSADSSSKWPWRAARRRSNAIFRQLGRQCRASRRVGVNVCRQPSQRRAVTPWNASGRRSAMGPGTTSGLHPRGPQNGTSSSVTASSSVVTQTGAARGSASSGSRLATSRWCPVREAENVAAPRHNCESGHNSKSARGA